MAKININFNDKNYSIDEAALSAASTELKSHLSTVMNGEGVTITIDGTSYDVDATKLAVAKDDFVAHLGIIAGDGSKVVVGGVEYGIDSAKVHGAISEIEAFLGGTGNKYVEKYDKLESGMYYSDLTVALADADAHSNENGVDNDNGAVAYVKLLEDDESVVILLQDQTPSETLNTTGNVVLNFNGKTLTMNNDVCLSATAGTLTLRDSTGQGVVNKKVVNQTVNDSIVTVANAALVVDGGQYVCTDATSSEIIYGFNATSNASITVNAATINIGAATSARSVRGIQCSTEDSSMTINKASVSIVGSKTPVGVFNMGTGSLYDVDIELSSTTKGYGVYNNSTGTLNVNGADINVVSSGSGNLFGIYINDSATATVEKVNIMVNAPLVNIGGDTFSNSGNGIQNFSENELILKGSSNEDIVIRATAQALSFGEGSKNYVYNGTYEGATQGGAYIYSSSSGETKIYGGIYRAVDVFCDIPEGYTKEEFKPNGALYVRDRIGSEPWTVDISDAVIEGCGTYGIAVASSSGCPTVNLTNCTISGEQYDVRVDAGNTVNLYGATVLEHETVLGALNDYR